MTTQESASPRAAPLSRTLMPSPTPERKSTQDLTLPTSPPTMLSQAPRTTDPSDAQAGSIQTTPRREVTPETGPSPPKSASEEKTNSYPPTTSEESLLSPTRENASTDSPTALTREPSGSRTENTRPSRPSTTPLPKPHRSQS